MQCPRCTAPTHVVRTVKLNSPNKTIRTRVCTICHFSFATQEVIDEPKTSPAPALCPKDS